MSQKDPWRW